LNGPYSGYHFVITGPKGNTVIVSSDHGGQSMIGIFDPRTGNITYSGCFDGCNPPSVQSPVINSGPTLSSAPTASKPPNYDIIQPDSSISKTAALIAAGAGAGGLFFPPAAPVLEPIAVGAAAVSVGTAPDVYSGASAVADKVLDPFPAGQVMDMLKPEEGDPPSSLDLNSNPVSDLRGPPPPPYRSWAAFYGTKPN